MLQFLRDEAGKLSHSAEAVLHSMLEQISMPHFPHFRLFRLGKLLR